MDKERIKEFLKSYENQLLTALIAFAILFRLYYFFKVGEQPIWWDEGDYLSVAKGLLHGWQNQEWWAHFTGIRPMLMPLLWAFFFLLNMPEIVIRFFTLLLPSVASVYLVYAIGRDIYDKKIGLISGFMLSVYWVHMFYTYRLLTDVPAMFLGLLSIYFFWSRYITRNEKKGLYYAIFFGVLGFSARFPLALVPISYPIYLLVVKKFKLLKDKTFLKSMGIGAFLLFVYLLIVQIIGAGILTAFKMYFGSSAVSLKTPILSALKNITFMIPSLMESIWFATLLIGLITFSNIIFGFDMFLKQKEKKLNSDFFVLLWGFLTLFFYIFVIRAANDRWLLMLMPPLFYISSKGILFIYNLLKRYNKEIAILAITLLILGGGYQHIVHSHKLINMKKDTYGEEKLAGLWIKENFPREDPKIITASVVQIAYYSEGYTYGFYNKPPKDCIDLYGKLKATEECQTKTEQQFEEKIENINPDYYIVHVFEPVFTPEWAYTYPQRHPELLEPVQVYSQNNQPLLAIYKFK